MRRTVLGAIAGVVMVPAAAWADIEFAHQNPITGTTVYSSQDARNVPGLGWFSEIADDLVIPSGGIVNTVKFWGGYFNEPAGIGHTHGFTIRFYSDAGGIPGTRLFERDIADFNETLFTQTGSVQRFSYSCALSPGFAVPAGGRYWMSTVAILDRGGSAVEPQWGWSPTSDGVSGNIANGWAFQPGQWAGWPTDFSMVVSGVVPGPGGVSVVAAGALALCVRRRR